MKPSSLVLAIFALASTGLAKKTCTPSFDYCASNLIQSKGKWKQTALLELSIITVIGSVLNCDYDRIH